MNADVIAEWIVIGVVFGGIGALILWISQQIRLCSYKKISTEIIQKAEEEAERIRKQGELQAKQHQLEKQRELEELWHQERRKIQKEEDRLKQREDKLESRMNLVEKKLFDTEKREAVLIGRKAQLEEEKKTTTELKERLFKELESISGLSTQEAKEWLIDRLTGEAKAEATLMIRRIGKEAEEEAEYKAASIISTAINRLAVQCVSESSVNTVLIPNDEMKGRIIGREGRNIRTLERATGVNFIIDDAPGTILVSGFDPIRLQIAKSALQDLLSDGRIHPSRIEEAVDKSKGDVQKLIRQNGEDAALRAGAINLHPEIIQLLGKLKFRYSYGQNVLDHSLEVSHLMGMMAAELGLDDRLARRIGLLHDMGKAVSHEMEGTHALIGRDLALKYGETPQVANGIGCHHHEIEPETIEGFLCIPADKISASRQGARIEAVEEYIKRLKKLEELAMQFPGVDKAYALQAGREIRVVVQPEAIDDIGTSELARTLTKRIEDELSYPGKIKVTVIRLKEIVEYAL